jgi:hypothetical protein
MPRRGFSAPNQTVVCSNQAVSSTSNQEKIREVSSGQPVNASCNGIEDKMTAN